MIELNLSFALKNLMDRLNYDIQSISSLLNVDPKTIENYLSKHSNPTAAIANKITKLIDENNLDIYSLLDIEPNTSYLFHGSKTGGLHGKISTLRNRGDFNDFDNGFYLSDSLKNAINYVIEQKSPVIYRFKKEDVLKGVIYNFSKEDNGERDWIIYIGLNRGKITSEEDEMFFREYYDKKFSNYDVLCGEIADSYNFDVLNDFFNNITDLEETRKALILANIGPQFVMKNEKDANNLAWVETYKIEKNLRDYLLSVVKEKKKILKQNRDTFCKDHTFDRTTTFEQIKKEMKKEYE